MEEKVRDPDNLKKVMPLIEQHVDEFLKVKLKAEIPVIGMFIGDKTILSIKKVFLQEIEILFPEIMNAFAGNLKKEMNVERMITERIESFEMRPWKSSFIGFAGFKHPAMAAGDLP